jgi:hypothetical protein
MHAWENKTGNIIPTRPCPTKNKSYHVREFIYVMHVRFFICFICGRCGVVAAFAKHPNVHCGTIHGTPFPVATHPLRDGDRGDDAVIVIMMVVVIVVVGGLPGVARLRFPN